MHLFILDNDMHMSTITRAAFARCSNLVKVTLPHTLEILPFAFCGCNFLEEVYAPSAVVLHEGCFSRCPRLRAVKIPYGITIGDKVFSDCPSLRHVDVDPECRYGSGVFFKCLTLEVLASAARFNIESGDTTWSADPNPLAVVSGTRQPVPEGPDHPLTGPASDPTVGIMSYLHWIRRRDAFIKESREQAFTTLSMLKLCKSYNWMVFTTTPWWLYGRERAHPKTRLMKFLLEKGEGGIAEHIISFLGDMRGCPRRDLRKADKGSLLKNGLEMGVLRSELNGANEKFWGVQVDGFGKLLDG